MKLSQEERGIILALSGLDVFKLLPKTNCKECGAATCMAFAMRVAAGKSKMEQCPYISEDAKNLIASAAPSGIKLIEFGPPDNKVKAGGEKVLYRHEETFYNKTIFSAEVNCTDNIDNIRKKIADIFSVKFNIFRKDETIDAITLDTKDCNVQKLSEIVREIKHYKNIPLTIKLNTDEILTYAFNDLAQDKPLLFIESEKLIKDKKLPMIVSGENIDELKNKVQSLTEAGFDEIVLHVESKIQSHIFSSLDNLRKQALKQKIKNLSFPVYAEAGDSDYALSAAFYICKYASVISFKKIEKEVLFPLFVLRNNIYQDPRKPIQVEAKLYEIGNVTEDSPVAVTTNFSLTYFAVSSEIESSRIPAYLLIVDTGGTSVLSAWASDKINADKINKAIKDTALESKVNHRNLIIPGYIYPVEEDLREVSGWNILVGPKESKDLGNYLKSVARGQ